MVYSNQKPWCYPSLDQLTRRNAKIWKRVIVIDDSEKFFQIRAKLPLHEREQLVEFLRENVDVFTWSAYEASGIDPSFVCHRLNVNPFITPKR